MPPQTKQSWERKRGIKLFNFRLYYQYKATVIKIVWYCPERNTWVSGVESPEVNPSLYDKSKTSEARI